VLDLDALRDHLDGLEEGLREARAAADLCAEGDLTALEELRSTADALADRVAALKLAVAGTGLSG
jgi:hypothetical protein